MKTLVDLLRDRAAGGGALQFLGEDLDVATSLSFAELERAARAIAELLREAGVVPGTPVPLLLGHGPDFARALFGCLFAGAIAVPVAPPRGSSVDSVRAIAGDCAARVVLTAGRAGIELPGVTCLPVDGALPDPDGWRAPAIGAEDLALLQYTSGSTRAPRGVMLTHANLLHNQALIHAAFGSDPTDIGLSWLPLHHDMGLGAGVLQPLFAAGTSLLMTPQAFLRSPARWLRALAAHRATVSGAPSFAYELCARLPATEELGGLDLSSWRVAFCGAEPVRREVLERFAARFSPSGFRRSSWLPCYGLAEATLLVSAASGVDGSGSGGDPVSCGAPAGDLEVVAVDPRGARLGPGERGELWIRGASVGRGYWARPDETRATFQAFLPGGEGPFLRSGDLGHVGERGELFVSGRLKDVIIVRGKNHHAEDLETTVLGAWPEGRAGCVAAFASEHQDGAVVVCEHRARSAPSWPDVVDAIVAAVAREHGLRLQAVAIVRAGQVPRTTSGKVQRGVARERFIDCALSVLHLWEARDRNEDALPQAGSELRGEEEIAAFLVSWLSAYLQRPVSSSTGFAAMGLDSLDVVRLTQMLGERTGTPVSPTLALDFPSVDVLARHLAG